MKCIHSMVPAAMLLPAPAALADFGCGTEMAASGVPAAPFPRATTRRDEVVYRRGTAVSRRHGACRGRADPGPCFERDVLSKAFYEITGIKVIHDTTIPEGQLVDTLFEQMRSGRNLYDAYVNDTDSIGAHSRYDQTVSLSAFMRGEGKDVTLPTLDIHDFIGRSFGVGFDGQLYQLPDQQLPISTGFAMTGSVAPN